MIRYLGMVLVACSLYFLTSCQKVEQGNIYAENPLNENRVDAAIILKNKSVLEKINSAYSVIAIEKAGLSQPLFAQLDDLNQDGQVDEVFLLSDISKKEIAVLRISDATNKEIVPRTKFTLSVKKNGYFNENGLYISQSDFVSVDKLDVPKEQEQDSKLVYMEGPLWESDKVGFRYYLDDRNRYDVFGKSRPEMALHKLSGDYHALNDWGADVLKVGKSMGLGSIAILTEHGPEFISNTQNKRLRIVVNGPFRSIMRTEYEGWQVDGTALDLDVTSDLEIRGGANWTEQRLRVKGAAKHSMVTGIVKHADASDLFTGTEDGIFFTYSWGKQSAQKNLLGMAVLIPAEFSPEVIADDPDSHLIAYRLQNEAAHYRFMVGWEHGVTPFKTREAFEAAVRKVAREYANSILVK